MLGNVLNNNHIAGAAAAPPVNAPAAAPVAHGAIVPPPAANAAAAPGAHAAAAPPPVINANPPGRARALLGRVTDACTTVKNTITNSRAYTATKHTVMRNDTNNNVVGTVTNVGIAVGYHLVVTGLGTVMREAAGALAQLTMANTSAGSTSNQDEMKHSDIAGAIVLGVAGFVAVKTIYNHYQHYTASKQTLNAVVQAEGNYHAMLPAARNALLQNVGIAAGDIPANPTDDQMRDFLHQKKISLVKEINNDIQRSILFSTHVVMMTVTSSLIFQDRSPESGNKALFAQLVRATSYGLSKGMLTDIFKVESNPPQGAPTATDKKYDDTKTRILFQGAFYAMVQFLTGSAQSYGESGPTAENNILVHGLTQKNVNEAIGKLLPYSILNGLGDGAELSYTPYLKIALGSDRTGGRTKLQDMANFRHHLVVNTDGVIGRTLKNAWNGTYASRSNMMSSFYQSAALISTALTHDASSSNSSGVVGINTEQQSLQNEFNGALLGIFTQLADITKMINLQKVPAGPLNNVVVVPAPPPMPPAPPPMPPAPLAGHAAGIGPVMPLSAQLQAQAGRLLRAPPSPPAMPPAAMARVVPAGIGAALPLAAQLQAQAGRLLKAPPPAPAMPPAPLARAVPAGIGPIMPLAAQLQAQAGRLLTVAPQAQPDQPMPRMQPARPSPSVSRMAQPDAGVVAQEGGVKGYVATLDKNNSSS